MILPRYSNTIPKSLGGSKFGERLSNESIKAFLSQNQRKVMKNSYDTFIEFTNEETSLGMSKKKLKKSDIEIEKIKKMMEEFLKKDNSGK